MGATDMALRHAFADADDTTALDAGTAHAAGLIAKVGRMSAEFPGDLANHLPMVLEAMALMGASPARMDAYAAHYAAANAVPAQPPSVAVLTDADWQDALGDRARERDFRDYFADRVAAHGVADTLAMAMPVLAEGVAASATHGLMRLAYALLRRDDREVVSHHGDREVAAALGYWAATWLPMAETPADTHDLADPVALLVEMRGDPAFDALPGGDMLLWRWAETMRARPGYQGLLGRLDPTRDPLPAMRSASLALYAGTMSFEALHALTGCHWLRIVAPHVPEPNVLAIRFWEVVAAFYAKIGRPPLPDAGALDALRALDAPSDDAIRAAAVASDDEHDLSLAFSALEEHAFTGDPLYRVVAARRVGLI